MSSLVDIEAAELFVPAGAHAGVTAAVERFLGERPGWVAFAGDPDPSLTGAAQALARVSLGATLDTDGAVTGLRYLADKLPFDGGFDDLHALFRELRPFVRQGSWVRFLEHGSRLVVHTFRFGKSAVRWSHKERERRAPRRSPRRRLLERAWELRCKGAYDEALELVDQALIDDPGDPELLRSRAITLHETDRHVEAEAAWRRVLELAPNSDEAWWCLGVALERLGQAEAGLACLRRSIESEPLYAYNFASHRYSAGQFEECLATLDRFPDIDAERARMMRMACLYELRRHAELLPLVEIAVDEAEADYRRMIDGALHVSPNEDPLSAKSVRWSGERLALVLYCKAAAQQALGQHDEAQQTAERTMTLDASLRGQWSPAGWQPLKALLLDGS